MLNSVSNSVIHAYESNLQLDRKLDIGENVFSRLRHHIEIHSISNAVSNSALKVHVPLGSCHGRQLSIFTDRSFNTPEFGQPWCLEVSKVVRFYWTSGTRSIGYELSHAGNDLLLTFWLLHIFLPHYFTLEDDYNFLHSGAVEMDGKALLFIAPSMGGKSTLTDYFINNGNTLISDDKVATIRENEKFIAIPSHPHHRPYRKFEDLGYRVTNFAQEGKSIHALYALEAVAPDDDIKITEICGIRKFETLKPAHLYSFPFLKSAQFEYQSEMLNAISLYRVLVPWSLERLCDVHYAICDHSNALT